MWTNKLIHKINSSVCNICICCGLNDLSVRPTLAPNTIAISIFLNNKNPRGFFTLHLLTNNEITFFKLMDLNKNYGWILAFTIMFVH